MPTIPALAQLSERKFELTSPELRDNILHFYSDLSIPIETKKDQVRWQSVLTSLDQLKSVAPVPTLAGSTTQSSPVPLRERGFLWITISISRPMVLKNFMSC
jgi:hypothetical protein